MSDVTAKVLVQPAPFQFQGIEEFRVYDLDLSVATDALATATHNLVPIAVGEALTSLKVIVLTSFASTSSATVKFLVGSDDLTSATAVTELAKGDVQESSWWVTAASEGKATYAHTTADTLDMTVATGTLTAGRALLVCGFIPVAKLTGNIL